MRSSHGRRLRPRASARACTAATTVTIMAVMGGHLPMGLPVGVPVVLGAGNEKAKAGVRVNSTEEAQRRFRRGIDLYNEGDFAAAFVELSRSYELAPHFRLLFNLGQVAYERKDYAAALDFFTRYLDEGSGDIPEERRREVDDDVAELRQRVGYLTITAREEASDILVDDDVKGRTPLEAPLTVNLGRHRVEVIAPSGERHSRLVDLAGGRTVWLRFEQQTPAPNLAPSRVAAATTPPRAAWAPVGSAPVVADPDAPDSSPSGSSGDQESADESDAPRRWGPWISWMMTGASAAGAAVTGALALKASLELQRQFNSFPLSPHDVDATKKNEHAFALASDALLIGTAVLAALSLYLTFSGPTPAKAGSSSSVARAEH